MNTDKLITIAIRRQEQAEILKKRLEDHGINATLCEITEQHERVGDGLRVRIKESDLIKALAVIEQIDQSSNNLYSSDNRFTILIPMDFSGHAMNACKIGFELAAIMNAEVQILHAYYISTTLYDISASPMQESELYKKSKLISSKLETLEKEIQDNIQSKQWPDVPYTVKSEVGLPEDVITGYARKTKPNLVIMGTRNKRQKEKELIGSVTCEVVDNSDCPTLIIPENSTLSLDSTIKVLFATNFDQRTLNTLERMMLLMKKLDISIFFTHFSSETDSWNEVKLMGIKNYFSNHYKNIPCEYRVIHGKNLLEEISQQINDLGVNLVIVNSHKRNLFAKLLNPSTARKMILQSETPILVFHS